MIKIKILTILLSLLQPLLILYFLGVDFQSFSSVMGTELEFLFIISNILVCHFFLQLDRFKISAVLLFLLTAISVHLYENVHNILALLFFCSCFWAIKDIKFRVLFASSFIGLLFGLFWFELLAAYILCFYQSKLLYIEWKYKNRNL